MRNSFNRMKLAWAFGDMGTFVPFVLIYIDLLHMPVSGILLGFGLAFLVGGLYYKCPFGIQPATTVGLTVMAGLQSGHITANAVIAAGLVTGVIWLILALSGIVNWLAQHTSKAIVSGIILGLGFSFTLKALGMMQSNYFISIPALCAGYFLLNNQRFPATLLLLAGGLMLGAARHFADWSSLPAPGFHSPDLLITHLGWQDLYQGTLLALPQLPLTLGNACIALPTETNRIYPDYRLSARSVSFATALMNLVGALRGGIPMSPGVGGLIGMRRFGAATGGSVIILGSLLILLALCFGTMAGQVLQWMPQAILGVMLFIVGAEMAISQLMNFNGPDCDKGAFYIMVMTAACAQLNIGLGFLLGVVMQQAVQRGWVQL